MRRWSFQYYLLLAPAVLLSVAVVLAPGLMTAYVAFTDWNGVSLSMNWIGTVNFAKIFADRVFWQALGNNVRWTLLFLTVPVGIGLLTAMLLLKRGRTRTVYQMIYLGPYVLAPVTNAILWLNIILNPVSGLLRHVRHLFPRNSPLAPLRSPLGSPDTALYFVALVDIWHYWGFLTVIYLAALRQTPQELVEAATVEGAGVLQLFRFIYLPTILPTVLLMFVIITIFSFLTFEYVYIMTGGGPAHGSEMLSTYAYTLAFNALQYGKAAATGLVMSFFGLVASVFYVWMSRREVSA